MTVFYNHNDMDVNLCEGSCHIVSVLVYYALSEEVEKVICFVDKYWVSERLNEKNIKFEKKFNMSSFLPNEQSKNL